MEPTLDFWLQGRGCKCSDLFGHGQLFLSSATKCSRTMQRRWEGVGGAGGTLVKGKVNRKPAEVVGGGLISMDGTSTASLLGDGFELRADMRYRSVH